LPYTSCEYIRSLSVSSNGSLPVPPLDSTHIFLSKAIFQYPQTDHCLCDLSTTTLKCRDPRLSVSSNGSLPLRQEVDKRRRKAWLTFSILKRIIASATTAKLILSLPFSLLSVSSNGSLPLRPSLGLF